MDQRPFAYRAVPFALFIGLMVLEPIIAGALPAGVDPRWLYAFRSAAVLVALAVFWRHYEELVPPQTWKPVDAGIAMAVGIGVFVLWIVLDVWPLAFSGGEGFDPRSGGRIHPGLAITRLAGAALVVPVMEELFWRSWLLRWLERPRFLTVQPGSVGAKAVIISSVLFATEHRLWFAGLLAGLAYAWLYKKTENLWYPVIAHALTNALLGGYVLATGSWQFW